MNEEQEVSVGVVGHDQQLMVQFSDGQYVIPAHALDVLGGKENLDLRQKTFGEFLSAVHLIGQKQTLNSLHFALIASHCRETAVTKTTDSF